MEACTGALLRALGDVIPKTLCFLCGEWTGSFHTMQQIEGPGRGAEIRVVGNPGLNTLASDASLVLRGTEERSCNKLGTALARVYVRSLTRWDNRTKKGLLQAQLLIGHQTEARKSTASTTTTERGPDGVNKNSSVTSGGVRTLCKSTQPKHVLHILNQHGIRADSNTYARILQECINMKDLAKGKQVHAHMVQSGFKPNTFLFNTLVNMYAKCGSVLEARQVFDKMTDRDVFSWNIMITGYTKHGCGREAFKIFNHMQQEGVTPDRVTFICLLNACASLRALEMGKQVHVDIIKAEITLDMILETALADMYAKCGSMKDARQVFDNMAQRDVVSWNAMAAGYAQHGCGREALEIYEQMQQEGVKPDSVTFTCILNACAHLGAFEQGKRVHADISKSGIVQHLILENSLVDMYAKCGSMKDARQVFNRMTKRDVVSWSAMITGYGQHGSAKDAFEMYEQMQREGITPDRVTFTCVLNACASLGALEKGKHVHADMSKAGIVPDIILENALVDMYAKCGCMKDAHHVFDNMTKRDLVSWNGMIAGCAQHGCGREALHLFEQMKQEGLKPNGITFISLLSACSHVGLVDEGRHYLDSMCRDHGLISTVEHFGCMVDILGRAGQLDEAQEFINKMPVKPDAGVWRALLGGCRTHGDVCQAWLRQSGFARLRS